MNINGNPAKSGTVVIRSNDQAEIDTPLGTAKLVFVQSSSNSLVYDHPTTSFTFGGFWEPLGVSANLTVRMQNQQQAYIIVFAIYAIGDISNGVRIVHYTAA